MSKRQIKGHTTGGYIRRVKTINRIECSIYIPKNLMIILTEKWNDTPKNVTFSQFCVALIEAGLEEL